MQQEDNEISNLSPETVQRAIEAVRGRDWDVNPYTVSDELKVSRAAIYRHAEAMKLIIAARGGSFGMDVQTSLDLTWQLRKLEQQNIELQQKLASNVTVPSGRESGGAPGGVGKSNVGSYKDSGEAIFNLVDEPLPKKNYFDQLADLSWKDLETVYYFKVASLRDHAKNLFKSEGKSDGTNGDQNISPTVQPIKDWSLQPSPPVTPQPERRRQGYASPFAQLKTSGANIGPIPKELISEQRLEPKPGVVSDEKSPGVDKAKPVSEIKAPVELETFEKQLAPEKKTQPVAKEIEPAKKAEPVKEIKSAKIAESPVPSKLETFMLLAAKIKAKLAEKIEVEQETATEAAIEAAAEGETELRISTKAEAEAELKTDLRKEEKTEAEAQAKTEAKAETKAESETEARAETKAEPKTEVEAKTEVETETKAGAELPRLDRSAPLEIEAPFRNEPKLIPYSKPEQPIKKIPITGASNTNSMTGLQPATQDELDTGDMSPIEVAPITDPPIEILSIGTTSSEVSPGPTVPNESPLFGGFPFEIAPSAGPPESTETKSFGEQDNETSGVISGDELRDLIQSHIKNATEQLAENSPGYSIGSGKEFEVWLNNPARNKFIGSTKSQEAASTEENTAAYSSDTYGFTPRTVPPEVRKACLILGVRQDRISYDLVQEAWKKAIAAPGVHPDQGGDTELAVYLNTAKDILMRWLDAQAPKLGKKFGPFKKDKEPPGKREKKDKQKEDQ